MNKTYANAKKAVLLPRDPRVSLFCACILSIAIACLDSLIPCLLTLLPAALLLAARRPSLSSLFPRFFAGNIFILFMWLIVPWTTPGPRLWPTLPASTTGIQLCLLITLKANTILAVFIAFLASLPLTTIAAALRSFRLPSPLIWLFLLMERNVAALGEEWRKLEAAAKLRGFAPATNMRVYKTLAALVALLFLGAYARGEHMRDALLLRGFDGSLPAVTDFGRPAAYDFLFALLTTAASACLLSTVFHYD